MAFSYPILGVNNHVTFEPGGHGMVSGALSVWPFWVRAEDMQQEWPLLRAWFSFVLVGAAQHA